MEITLKRALSSLTWQRRLSFAWDLGKDVLKMPTELSQEMIDAMMDDDAISSFYARLSQSYPEVRECWKLVLIWDGLVGIVEYYPLFAACCEPETYLEMKIAAMIVLVSFILEAPVALCAGGLITAW